MKKNKLVPLSENQQFNDMSVGLYFLYQLKDHFSLSAAIKVLSHLETKAPEHEPWEFVEIECPTGKTYLSINTPNPKNTIRVALKFLRKLNKFNILEKR